MLISKFHRLDLFFGVGGGALTKNMEDQKEGGERGFEGSQCDLQSVPFGIVYCLSGHITLFTICFTFPSNGGGGDHVITLGVHKLNDLWVSFFLFGDLI